MESSCALSAEAHCTCIGQKDELVSLLEDMVIFGIQVGLVVPREPATEDAGAEAAPDISVCHASH